MVHIEQFGSSTYHLNGLPQDRPLERYELIELLRQAVEAGIDPEEFLEPHHLERFKEQFAEGSLF